MRINRSSAYVAAFLAILAQILFLFVWVNDSRQRSEVRIAALFWPLFMVFLAEAMRMSGRPGDEERLRRELIRLKLSMNRDEDDRDRMARGLDAVDHQLAPILLFLLPVLAIAFGVYLLVT